MLVLKEQLEICMCVRDVCVGVSRCVGVCVCVCVHSCLHHVKC